MSWDTIKNVVLRNGDIINVDVSTIYQDIFQIPLECSVSGMWMKKEKFGSCCTRMY